MPNTDLTRENILEEVYDRLGVTTVDVELEDSSVDRCIADALRVYNRYVPYTGRAALSDLSQATKRYRIDDRHSELIGVVDMDFVSRRVDPAGVDPFDPYVTSLTGPNYGDETFSDVHQRRSYAEDAQRIISSEPEWFGNWESFEVSAGVFEERYFLYVDVFRDTFEGGYTYTSRYPNTDAGRQRLPAGDVDWFFDWTTMRAKHTLARIRGKFGGIANPEGAVDEIDSQTLLEEVREDRDRLIEEIKMRRPPYVPLIE